MKYDLFRATAATASVAALAVLSLPAAAQTPPGTPDGPPVAFSPGIARNGRFLPNGTNGPGDKIDPAHSYTAVLLRREDVRFELNLSRRQWGDLEDLQNKAQAEFQERMRGILSPGAGGFPAGNVPAAAPGNQNAPNPGGPTADEPNTPARTPEARRQQMQQRAALARQHREQMSALANSYQGELDKQTAAVLTPVQTKRLHQIDLQFRGPLALTDPKLAQEMNLTPEQREGITAALQNYRATEARAFQIAVQGMPRPTPNTSTGTPNGPILLGQPHVGPGGRAGLGLNSPQRIAELQERLAEARAVSEQAKQAAEDKVLALLAPQQRAQWRAWTGTPMRWMDQN